jgi:hypothetical protein
METKTTFKKQSEGERAEFLKKTYQKPVLLTYGLVKHLTQSSGTVAGDAATNMTTMAMA